MKNYTLLGRIRFITTVVITAFFTLFLVQNSEDVQVAILLWTISMPRAVLLLLMLGIGFLAGYLATLRSRKSHSHDS